MKVFYFLVLGVILVGSFTSCSSLSEKIPFELKSSKEKEIATLNAKFATDLAAKDEAIQAARVEVSTVRDGQEQAAANAFFAIDRVFGTIPSPLRTDLISHNYALEGWAALDHRMPSYATMVEINERITRELDETKTSLAQLKQEHDTVMAVNVQLVAARTVADNKVASLTQEEQILKDVHATELAGKQRGHRQRERTCRWSRR